jgi:hypothetical protein
MLIPVAAIAFTETSGNKFKRWYYLLRGQCFPQCFWWYLVRLEYRRQYLCCNSRVRLRQPLIRVTVTDANACVTNTSATVSVNSLPTPSVSFTDGSGNTGNDGVICLGDQATLTVSGSGTYLRELLKLHSLLLSPRQPPLPMQSRSPIPTSARL